LTRALVEGGAPSVTAVSTDLFYDPRDGIGDDWRAAGVDVIEMEAATLLALTRREGVAGAIVLAVTDVLGPDSRHRIEPEALQEAGVALGRAGYAAFAMVS
jgi:purine-nucleoside phosphorylase